MLTVVLGLGTALLWGLPDVPLAVAVRNVGADRGAGRLALLFGTLLVAPVGLFVDSPGLDDARPAAGGRHGS